MSINTATYEGFLVGVKPPRTTNTGTNMLEFGLSLCVDPKAEDPKRRTIVINCQAFGPQAERLEKEIQDGADYAVAQLTPKGRFYTDDMGREKSFLVYWVSNYSLSRRKKGVKDIPSPTTTPPLTESGDEAFAYSPSRNNDTFHEDFL
ncbi:MAG: hypothetical protein LBE98_01680 [Puniceicoccales bacterium]|jgi:hypothetical protein|nr:hypothetical protein [Puniceicoccales bacterium]